MASKTEQVNMDNNTINTNQPKSKELVSNKRKLKIIDICQMCLLSTVSLNFKIKCV